MISNFSIRSLGLLAAVSAGMFFAVPAFAQEIAADHLKAARAAVTAIGASDPYDGILPDAAAALKQTLIQKNPDMQALIEQTVDAKTIALAPRRADLEKEIALAYAKVFTQDDLNGIATFYESAAGKKLLEQGPLVVRELSKAAEIWQRGVARDLALEVGKSLDAEVAKMKPAAPIAPVPATDGAAPAADGAAPAADGAAPADDGAAPAPAN